MKKVLTILGTRPEAIKLAPVIKELSKYPDVFESVVGVTGQHDLLLHQELELFHIIPDFEVPFLRAGKPLQKTGETSKAQELFEKASQLLIPSSIHH